MLVAGVYLFHEVRATPAHAEGSTMPAARATVTEHHDEEAPAAARAPGHVTAPSRPTTPTAPTVATAAPDSPALPASDDDTGGERANATLDAIMDRANKAYDRQDFEEAKMIAGKVLSKQPNNVRMLRIMVSSTCIEGDASVAQKYFEQLPKPDRDQMKLRCDKYGVSFKDPPQ